MEGQERNRQRRSAPAKIIARNHIRRSLMAISPEANNVHPQQTTHDQQEFSYPFGMTLWVGVGGGAVALILVITLMLVALKKN